ncbi:Crinkler (CRN) family protein [Phytophthora nicotianae]|uniref:Crinkler (CRN) family protein n=1 Tax=Phytophthora nicotianae TaxID=4792 RepID=A0A0W8C858_PHYNI|nr:Crinkler (CRN) family protein [Phytophthora nicotianae]
MTVKLFCVVVKIGNAFSVDVDLSQTVDDLKYKIKERKRDLLKLYLARDGERWLNSRDAEFKTLKKGETPDRIKSLMQEELLLDETARLDDDDYLRMNFQPGDRDIHVLVECPDEPEQVVQQDGFVGSLLENWFLCHLPWSSLQSLFTVEKKKRA